MILHINDLPDDVKLENSVAIDTETMGLRIKSDRLCLVQLCSNTGEVHIVQIQKGCFHKSKNLRALLINPNVLKIFHYARFDVAMLNYSFNIKVRNIYCTKIASKLARTYTDKHGLKNLCKEILNVELSKQEQSSDWGNAKLQPEQLKYAVNDVLYLHELRNKLNYMLEREELMDLAQRCFDNIELITDLELSDINPELLFQH